MTQSLKSAAKHNLTLHWTTVRTSSHTHANNNFTARHSKGCWPVQLPFLNPREKSITAELTYLRWRLRAGRKAPRFTLSHFFAMKSHFCIFLLSTERSGNRSLCLKTWTFKAFFTSPSSSSAAPHGTISMLASASPGQDLVFKWLQVFVRVRLFYICTWTINTRCHW